MNITMESINQTISEAVTPHTYINKALKIFGNHKVTLTELEYTEITAAFLECYALGKSDMMKQVLDELSRQR